MIQSDETGIQLKDRIGTLHASIAKVYTEIANKDMLGLNKHEKRHDSVFVCCMYV